MAKFLNTSAINYFLEELIKETNDKLVLISPYLKVNNRIKELLQDKNRLKIDIRIVYGKAELNANEIAWLKNLEYIRTSYCENLHAKCYMNEKKCIITSMNLYDFSQINNNEMGILINKEEDIELYKEIKKEAERIIRISDEVRMTVEKVEKQKDKKLSTSKIAQKLKMKYNELHKKLIENGYIEIKNKKEILTEKGKKAGGEVRKFKGKEYFAWFEDMKI